jgi:tRNA G18 (ribose-2'-O)-methylase SpoU
MRKLSMDELNRLSNEEFRQRDKPEVVVILDNIRSQNNVGSVFRTCDAFLVKKIYLCGITSTPPHREIHKTALGATESVEWEYFADTLDALEQLKASGYKVFAAEQADKKILLQNFTVEKTGKIALVFGHEVRGVDQAVMDKCDGCIEIPQFGTKHSLNIAVAAGIVIWEVYRKMQL